MMLKAGWWRSVVRVGRQLERGLGVASSMCIACGGLVKGEVVGEAAGGARCTGAPALRELCLSCRAAVPWISTIVCKVCGRYEACPDCARRDSSAITASRSAVQYSSAMKGWLAKYKYRGNERLGPLFSRMMGYAYGRLREEWVLTGRGQARVLLTFVPLSERRYRERGFNQARSMAEGVGRQFGLPFQSLLDRNRHTGKQSFKGRRERMESMDQVFAAEEGAAQEILRYVAGGTLNIVIVDDVYTTGSTLHQCGKVLRAAAGEHFETGKIRIYGLTWAR